MEHIEGNEGEGLTLADNIGTGYLQRVRPYSRIWWKIYGKPFRRKLAS